MSNPNVDLVRRSYDAFARGDLPTVLELFASDIEWHVPGRCEMAGTYKGHDGVVSFFEKGTQLSDGTLRVEADQIIGEGDRVVVLSTVSAQRKGVSWSSPEVHVWRVEDGRAVSFREFQGDQQTEDEFWSR